MGSAKCKRHDSGVISQLLALRVVAKYVRYGVARLANRTTIGLGSRLVSGTFGSNVILPLNENTP